MKSTTHLLRVAIAIVGFDRGRPQVQYFQRKQTMFKTSPVDILRMSYTLSAPTGSALIVQAVKYTMHSLVALRAIWYSTAALINTNRLPYRLAPLPPPSCASLSLVLCPSCTALESSLQFPWKNSTGRFVQISPVDNSRPRHRLHAVLDDGHDVGTLPRVLLQFASPSSLDLRSSPLVNCGCSPQPRFDYPQRVTAQL